MTDAEAVLFGFPPTTLRVSVRPRSKAWRVGGAARTFGVFLVAAPFVALFPPHAVWPVGALLTGGILARRRLTERFTLDDIAGDCPKCGRALTVKGGRLRAPHPLPCDACHHESTLRFPDDFLAGAEAD